MPRGPLSHISLNSSHEWVLFPSLENDTILYIWKNLKLNDERQAKFFPEMSENALKVHIFIAKKKRKILSSVLIPLG